MSEVCHSDIHAARGEWGEAIFPLVPGHEIAGTVEEIGTGVTKHAVGDRVGVGCLVDSCRECENCLAGEEQYCLNGATATYNSIGKDGRPTEGGYSTYIVVDQDFVLAIPEGIDLDVAAPLLCAGITLFSPLRHWGAETGRVGRDRRSRWARPHGRQDRPCDGSRGFSALPEPVEAGGRQENGRRPTTTPPPTMPPSRSSGNISTSS